MALDGTQINGLNEGTTSNHLEKRVTAKSVFSGLALEELLKDDSVAPLPPHDVIRSRLPFDKTDSYWWDTTGVVLSKLMLQANYSLPLHYKTLAYYYDVILPAWGPIPLKTDGKPGGRPWKATFLEDGSVFEPSLNLRTSGTTETAIRFSLECSDERSGTTRDPLNQKAADDLVARCAAADPDFDLTVYNYMRDALMLDDEEAARLKQEFPDNNAAQMFLAFDFEKGGRILGKCAPFLNWKSKQLGITQKELALRVICGIPEVGSLYKDALVAWDKFMISFPAELGGEPSPESLNFDVVKPGKSSRVKIYIRPYKTSFNSVKHFYTLGGLLNDDTTLKGVVLLRLFYEVVFDIKDGDEDTELTAYHPGWGSVLFNCAFKPGAPLPVPQFYVTIWKYMPTDISIVEKLSEFWKRIGWEKQANKYADDWQKTFPWLDGSGWGNTSAISFAYKDDGSGVYQSVYYSPMAHIAAVKLGYV
ncbi:tryptophan dimethylallyltransferase-domain-containing protein [Amylocarpus encephaloides]|uniref:Tryptophan dimethylallyltransferase-domain-containing protein n=1 Tax=Amylocarpus encephaloides TaxID=45428 RepID=A0A9P7YD48_9HELO|nr:tryptophan dimethylallyltransferase-domain-containing protein [Amylocarpus encephaloides]